MNHSTRRLVVLAVAGMVAADVGFMAMRHQGAATTAAPEVATAGSGESGPGPGVDPAHAEAAVTLPTTTSPTTVPPVTTPAVVRGPARDVTTSPPTVAAPRAQHSATDSPAAPVAPPPAQPPQQPSGPPTPNNPPVLPPHDWRFTIRRDQTLTIQDDRLIRDASDPEGGPVYFALVSFEGPGTGSNDRAGHIAFSPNGPGTATLRFRVQDDAGAGSEQVNRIVITVT